jgi:hypothetical protein
MSKSPVMAECWCFCLERERMRKMKEKEREKERVLREGKEEPKKTT